MAAEPGGAPPPPPQTVPPHTPVADLLAARPDPGPAPVVAGLRPGQPLQLHYPLPERASEVDPYGWRWSDQRQAWRMHAGQDLVAPEGTPVLAMLPGRVALVDSVDGYGLTVVLEHGRGWQTLYAHLSSSGVQPGEQLAAGAPLGRVGSSGRASTAHLHVELRRHLSEGLVALDPTPLLSEAAAARPLLQAQGLLPRTP